MELYQARHQVGDLEQALRWNSETLRLFADGQGDLWECGADAEVVMGRGRLTVDGAVAAAGSIVALNLLRLADLTGSAQLQTAGERLLGARLGAQPAAHAQLLIALDYVLGPRQQLVRSVPAAARQAEPFLAAVRGRFLPRTVTMVLNQGDDTLARLSSLRASRPPVDTNYLEDYAVTIGPDGKNLPQTTTEWNDWQSKITGYYVEKQPGAHGGNDIYSPGGWFTTINHATIQNPDTLHTDQKVTEYTTSTRSGISYKYNVEEDTESLGTRVVDVSLVPYIQPQSIIVRGRGLKARTKFFTFFDGEDMTNYCTPLTEAEYNLGESIKRKVPRTYVEANPIVSDADGNVYFILRLPVEKRFRVQKKF